MIVDHEERLVADVREVPLKEDVHPLYHPRPSALILLTLLTTALGSALAEYGEVLWRWL